MTDYETAYRALREGLADVKRKTDSKALALWSGTSANLVAAQAVSDVLADLRALLASSPAEGTSEGEVWEDEMPLSAFTIQRPAPVSSGEVGCECGGPTTIYAEGGE